jgi:hypothetical protein
MKLRASVLAAALLAGGMVLCAPAQADTGGVTDFLDTLDSLGIGAIDPGQAVALGQSVCPLLADRAQNTADIAAKVSDAMGRPLGIGTMFTGAAVSFLCPRAVDNIVGGRQLLPLFG